MRTTRFTVAMPRPETHLYEITMEIDTRGASTVDLVLPVWTPGSYLVREFSRHVRDLRAREVSSNERGVGAGARGGGRPIAAEKISKNTWRFSLPSKKSSSSSSVLVSYRVYAHELTVRTSHLDSTHGYGNGANLFFYVDGRKDEPQEVVFRLPRGWRTSMALPARGGVFRAASYDELVDSPFECGTHRTFDFRVKGVPHTLAIWGSGNEDAARLVKDLKKLVTEAASLFGGLPYERYLFLAHLAPGARGGLEHRASQSVAVDPWAFQPAKAYRGTLLLFSHELFHAWNVKRIRPEALGPFDYTKEVHTKDLWAMEGITSYYEVLLAVRAGLLTPAQGFEEWTTSWSGHLETPGRDVQSAEMASFDTWIRFYRPDENSVNVAESYYRRGQLLGLALDLTIRGATAGRRGLDDVMRLLWRRWGSKGKGYPEGAVEDAAASVLASRAKARRFFDRYVRGTGTADLARLLPAAGLELRLVPEAEEGVTDESPVKTRGDFGWKTKTENGRLVVAEVREGGAAMRAGMSAADEIVAIDGVRASEDFLRRKAIEAGPGARLRVTVFRRERLRELGLVLGARKAGVWKIVPAKGAAPAARRLARRWLHVPVSG
ncbi:MAG TPA: PDZ domain-containing protein [Thermoanaerobaculia bacterium]|nr:PDZ domain-containing protein [Thermoanaerobaculia bacterium]